MGRSEHRSVTRRRFWVRLVPQGLGNFERVDLAIGPPDFLMRALVQLPVMAAAERDGELIADFEANAARLRKAQMVWIARLAAADQTRLGCNELEVRLVTQPPGLGECELALVDWTRSRIKPEDEQWS